MAFVQSRSAIQSTGGGTQPLGFTSNLTAGNMIVVLGGSSNSADTLTVSDGVNTYAALTAILNSGGSAAFRVFYAFNVSAGADTVTLAGLTGANSMLAIHEFSLLSNFDTSHSASGSGNSQDSGTATTSFASETLFGFSAGVATTLTSINPGAGWNTAESSFSGGLLAYITEYQIGVATGGYNSQSTVTVGKGGSFSWAAEIATFYKLAAASSSDWQLGGRRHSTRVILPGRGIDA